LGEAGVATEDRADGRNTGVDEYGRVEDEGRMALLLGRSVDSVEGEVGDRGNGGKIDGSGVWCKSP